MRPGMALGQHYADRCRASQCCVPAVAHSAFMPANQHVRTYAANRPVQCNLKYTLVDLGWDNGLGNDSHERRSDQAVLQPTASRPGRQTQRFPHGSSLIACIAPSGISKGRRAGWCVKSRAIPVEVGSNLTRGPKLLSTPPQGFG